MLEIWIRPTSATGPGTLHDRTLFATRAAWWELAALVELGMSPTTLDETKQFLHNYTVDWAATVSRRLARPGTTPTTAYPGPASSRRFVRAWPAWTRHWSIGRSAPHLQYRNMGVVFITADADAMKQRLVSGTPTPITHAGEKSSAHMADDAGIERHAVPVREENITIMSTEEVFER